jgi:hypothetical protein
VRIVHAHDGLVWLVTSDRELRQRVGDRAAKLMGGGGFIGQI